MVKQFVFYSRGYEEFRCPIEIRSCSHHGCNILSDIGFEFCRTHLETDMHLQIKPTSLPGGNFLGLFASDGTNNTNTVVFKKGKKGAKHGDFITAYNGEILTIDEMFDRYRGRIAGPYCAHLNEDNVIDSACLRGVGSMINHKTVSGGANARIYIYRNEIRIAATKDIKNGDEIFINYLYNPNKLENEGFSHETINI